MIIAKLIIGRLGNQMFQYAYCRAIKEAFGGDLAFSFDKVYQQKEVDNSSNGFENSLCYFNVDDFEVFEGDVIQRYGNILQLLLYRSFQYIRRKFFKNKSWQTLFCRIGLYQYNDKDYDFYKNFKFLKKKSIFRKLIICYDFLEYPKLFDCIRTILIKEFTPKLPPLKCNEKLYQIINNTNSIYVSVRRGDYLEPQYTNKFYICDETYIYNAIDKINQLIDNPVLVFFSDDIKWVKENIKTNLPSYYESGEDPVWEKLRLMYSCKHFIISNSTFSWWAQYLSRNENKIVISPDRWYNDESMNIHHLISKDFITIPCGKTEE
jgi:hypothetical protein